MRKVSLALSALLLAPACGGAPPPDAAVAASEASASATAPRAPAHEAAAPAEGGASPHTLPTACAEAGDVCSPPAAFVKRLCADVYPDVALTMFAKGSPWTRGYLTRNVKAWNASGGASSDDELAFDEEVLVLTRREPPKGGMVVSGAGGGYDVLRWDGTCSSLASEELTLKPPPKAKNAKVVWKELDRAVRDALTADAHLAEVYAAWRKECKGVTLGDVTDKCVKADTRLAASVVDYVRKGGTLPAPTKIP